jgi:hypothetical protein
MPLVKYKSQRPRIRGISRRGRPSKLSRCYPGAFYTRSKRTDGLCPEVIPNDHSSAAMGWVTGPVGVAQVSVLLYVGVFGYKMAFAIMPMM